MTEEYMNRTPSAVSRLFAAAVVSSIAFVSGLICANVALAPITYRRCDSRIRRTISAMKITAGMGALFSPPAARRPGGVPRPLPARLAGGRDPPVLHSCRVLRDAQAVARSYPSERPSSKRWLPRRSTFVLLGSHVAYQFGAAFRRAQRL